MPDELWNEVRDIVQETGIKTIPMEKKCKKAKWLSWEAIQTAVKRREGKSQGDKERYRHLNEEFKRITRRDKKAFFSDQCKEIEEKNRMGKTSDLFKKIRQPSEWEKIIANEATDKQLISKIYKQLLQLNSRKINDTIKKMGQRTKLTFLQRRHMDG